MRKYIVFIMLFLSCCGDPIKEGKGCGELISKQANYMSKKYQFPMLASGGFNEGNIKGYSYALRSHQKIDVKDARVLIVKFVEELVERINNELKNPIEIKNLEIYIYFFDAERDRPYTQDIGLAKVTLIYEEVRFSVDRKGTFDLETIHVEPYAQAYEKVMGKKYEP